MKMTCPQCKRRIKIKRSRIIKCNCGYNFSYEECFGRLEKIYLVDANICIYAINKDKKRGAHCLKVLNSGNIATTDVVLKEVYGNLPKPIRIYKIKKISDDIKELHTNSLKQPSNQDLSLLQVAIKQPEISGIITYDKDFKDIATSGLVMRASPKGSSKFWLGNASEFLLLMKKRRYKI